VSTSKVRIIIHSVNIQGTFREHLVNIQWISTTC
jgi:hypothetical protein